MVGAACGTYDRRVVSSPTPSSAHPTCEDCFFRRELLCALPGNTICPTFRAGERAPVLQAVSQPGPKPVAAAAAA
jgi:hypothetical protein